MNHSTFVNNIEIDYSTRKNDDLLDQIIIRHHLRAFFEQNKLNHWKQVIDWFEEISVPILAIFII